MKRIAFDDMPEKMAEILEKQEKIIAMLSDSPANQRAQFITRKEVKRLLNVNSDVTILSMEEKQILKPYRAGRRVLYKIEEVEKALKEIKR